MSTAPAAVIPTVENILYATDFSQCSRAAMPYLRQLALRYGATVHILHVCELEPLRSPEVVQHAAEVEMHAEIASAGLDDIPLSSTVKSGDLWENLSAIIKQNKVDMIVLGTHGRRGLRKLMLGSEAEEVFRHAPCPVLTVGPQSLKQEAAGAAFSRILFATDYSEGSLHALPYAISLADVNRSQFLLLHVLSCSMEALPLTRESVSPGMQLGAEFMGQAIAYARERLAEVIPPEIMRNLKPEILVECGPVAETILNTARKKNADLVVIGAHRSLSTHLPWAIASSVISEAHCPVLTVRE